MVADALLRKELTTEMKKQAELNYEWNECQDDELLIMILVKITTKFKDIIKDRYKNDRRTKRILSEFEKRNKLC